MSYRKLTDIEIDTLKLNGCKADCWTNVMVAHVGFSTDRLSDVIFSGSVQIGRNDSVFVTDSDVKIDSGIRHARLHNCIVGNDVIIENIGCHISNYNIGDNAIVRNVGRLETCGISSFGNGTSVCVLNEAGGREVPIYDDLSAQCAYILAMYRQKVSVISKLGELIADYANSVSSSMGSIGAHAHIENCGSIKNFRCGDYAVVDGACDLNNGTLNSCNIARSVIGSGVVARDFIISTSSEVTSGAVLDKCFVGQGCEIGKQFSAENTLFFANCVAMHGEACSVFAGPYTVTHHKSTLLIATMFSFMNAGSGSNQSNHKYKLGAVHQGVCERGCKLGSDSYLLLPVKIGSFSTVMGRHYTHVDTTDLPFSYLVNDDDKTRIIPGVNLRNIGTYRDCAKWPKRDQRKGKLLDHIDFELHNPKVVIQLTRSIDALNNLESDGDDDYVYMGCKISKSSRMNGLQLYRMTLDVVIGHYLAHDAVFHQTSEDVKWIDVAGMIMRSDDLEAILNASHDSITSFESALYDYDYTTIVSNLYSLVLQKLYGSALPDRDALLCRAKQSATELSCLIHTDAHKDFNADARVSYGIDGDQLSDFEMVRGSEADNSALTTFDQFMTDYLGF